MDVLWETDPNPRISLGAVKCKISNSIWTKYESSARQLMNMQEELKCTGLWTVLLTSGYLLCLTQLQTAAWELNLTEHRHERKWPLTPILSEQPIGAVGVLKLATLIGHKFRCHDIVHQSSRFT